MLAYKKNSTHPHSNQPKLSRVAPCGYAVSVVCYEKVVANTSSLVTMLAFNKAPDLELQVWMKFVWLGLKKTCIFLSLANKFLHVKLASLATVKSCDTIGPISWWQMFDPV